MKRLAVSAVVVSSFLLVACPGANPFDPGSFADQFRHDLTFSLGAATQPAGTIVGDETDLAMFQLRARVDSPSEPVRIDTLDFRATGTGNDATDVSAAGLYIDGNLNGTLDLSDLRLGGETQYLADDGRIRFGGLNLVIDDGETVTMILVYDLAGTAVDGANFGVALASEDDVDAEGDDSGCPVEVDGLPVASPQRTVDTSGGVTAELVVTLGAQTPAARSVGPTDTAVEMLQIAVETTGVEDVSIDSITFAGSGSAREDVDITATFLFQDVNANGVLDLGLDVLVSMSAYDMDDGRTTFPGIAEVITPGTLTHYLLVYDLEGTAWIDQTFRAGVLTSDDVSATEISTGSPMDVTGPPLEGEIVTITFAD